MTDIKNLTPEIMLDDTVLYLIRAIHGTKKDEVMFVGAKNEAKLAVDSLAAERCKELEDEWTKVFRQDLDKGRKVVISTQSLGRLLPNGSITEIEVIDYIRVPHGVIQKGRHELDDSESSSSSSEEEEFDESSSSSSEESSSEESSSDDDDE